MAPITIRDGRIKIYVNDMALASQFLSGVRSKLPLTKTPFTADLPISQGSDEPSGTSLCSPPPQQLCSPVNADPCDGEAMRFQLNTLNNDEMKNEKIQEQERSQLNTLDNDEMKDGKWMMRCVPS